MKNTLLFLMLFFAVSCFGANYATAQTEPEKILYVELSIPDGRLDWRHKFEVPSNYNFEESWIGGGFATTGCLDCPLAAEYFFGIFKAEKITGQKLTLGIKASFTKKPRCNTTREILINPNKKETINLKCGVKLFTYSAVPDKSE